MKQGSWFFYIVSSGSSGRRRLRIPGIGIAVILAILILGGLGLGRCLFFVGSYAYAKFGVYNERRENHDLLLKMRFLAKLAEQREHDARSLVAFEDRARLKYGMNTISEDARQAGIGGRPSSEEMLLASLEDPVILEAGLIKEQISALLRQIDLQDSTFSRMAQHILRQHDRWAQRPSIWPTRSRRITSHYGYRFHPFLQRNMFHEGLDIADQEWTPIFSTADGIVSFVGSRRDFGNVVEIDHHGNGFSTVYAHLRHTPMVEGKVVKRGELIGYMGNTGRSTGTHLHYEVRHMGRHVNPRDYLLPEDTVVD